MGLVFHSVPIREQMRGFVIRYRLDNRFQPSFLRLIDQTEHLTFYHWEYVDDESDFIDFIPLFYKRGSDEMVRVTQGVFGLKKKRLSEYFSNCQPLVKAIQNKELRHAGQVFDYYSAGCITVWCLATILPAAI